MDLANVDAAAVVEVAVGRVDPVLRSFRMLAC